MSSQAEMGIGGEDLRLAVDCSSQESPKSPVMAAGSVCLRKEKKGTIDIGVLLSLPGQIQRKLDQVCAGLASKPNRIKEKDPCFGPKQFCWGLGFRIEPKMWSGSLPRSGSKLESRSSLGSGSKTGSRLDGVSRARL
jgi:hypothetical protein